MGMRQVIRTAVMLALPAGILAAGYALRTHLPFPRTYDLGSPNPAERAAAVRAMGYPGDVPRLLGALHDENADVRLLAAEHLGGRGPQSAERTRGLIDVLKDPHAGVRREAAEALSSIGADAVPALCEALADPDPRVRAGAALALSDVAEPKGGRERTREELSTVTPLLKKLVDDGDAEVRKNAAAALRDVARKSRQRE
jgi:HEAT repeat protein